MSNSETIILAGGCFWGTEKLFSELPGITDTDVGYIGGSEETANYEDVKTGQTGHAEAVRIEFDTSVTDLDSVLEFFFKIHDPTTLNRQGNDRGSQYRSTIFAASEEQAEKARLRIEKENAGERWKGNVVTSIEIGKVFYPAEDYHQDYLKKNPGGYNCHFIRD
jgi:methionine-S-sulfoxide reductase